MTEYKLCPDCQQTYPATTEFFAPFKRNTTTGLYTYCRECSRKRDRAYKEKNREQIRQRDNERSAANREKKRAIFKRWYDANCKSTRVIQTPADKRRLKSIYNRTNRDKINASKRRYHSQNPYKNRQWINTRRARKLSLPADFSDSDWLTALDYWHYCCAYCGHQQDFWHTIEADHFIPITDPTCPGTVPANMIPACKACNSSKHDRPAAEWLTEKLGKQKASAVLARIDAYFQTLR